jgi:hypothetical protein
MSKQTILICDDNKQRVGDWRKRLEKLEVPFRIEGLTGEGLGAAIEELGKRRERSRGRKRAAPLERQKFDKAAILIIDYDLLDVDPKSSLNGENVAYLARCYSYCGLIVMLNRYDRENAFDLSLKGHPDSYADVNLSADQLHNPGLWRQPWAGFRPWYWPLLPAAAAALERRITRLAGHLDHKILTFWKLPTEAISLLPRSTIEYLASDKSPESTTFRNFVENSSMGLRLKDQVRDETLIARVAAARAGKWLERVVLPGQDILVDAPHLALRFPSLLRGDTKKLDTWNASASLFPPKLVWSDKVRLRQKILRHSFQEPDWLSRGAWFWSGIRNLEDIEEVRNPWSAERPDVVFCEDVSRFLPRREAREFVADLASSFVRRFVVAPDSCSDRKLAAVLRGVNYRAKMRFSI